MTTPAIAIDVPPARSELQRFLVLFDRLVTETDLWIRNTPPDRLDWLPIDTPHVRFGDRLTTVTIKSLYVHMAVAEHHWSRNLRDCAAGEEIPLPRGSAFGAELTAGDFVALARRSHEENLEILRDFSPEILAKPISFAGDGSHWTVMGFLWGMYGHRAYHLGNLDIYLRQSDNETPDFFSFQPKAMA